MNSDNSSAGRSTLKNNLVGLSGTSRRPFRQIQNLQENASVRISQNDHL